MARDDDRLVRYGRNIRLGRLDHPVDVPAGRVVDEGIDAIPVRIPTMKNIGFRKGDGDVAIRMSGPIVLQGKLGTVQVDAIDSVGHETAVYGSVLNRSGDQFYRER